MTEVEMMGLMKKADDFVEIVNQIEIDQTASIRAKNKLEHDIMEISKSIKDNKEALAITSGAIEILQRVSDESVAKAYRFLETNLNEALARMFKNTTRKIRLHEYTRNNQYPQLEIELEVTGGKKRSLKADSGHGLAQIVSLLSILCLIAINGSRRFLVMDEVMSGLSIHNRMIVTDLLWAFTDIGFQFIINEHGYVPKGSKVYHLEMVGDVSSVKNTYIETEGVYLNNSND